MITVHLTPALLATMVRRMATNAGLRRAYTLWAAVYDPLTRFLRWSRRHAVALLDIAASDRVLLVGCGTGADFEFLRPDAEYVAVDITPAMLRKAEQKVGCLRVQIAQMDAMALDLPSESFDKAILHLIVAVVPDPVRALREVERVLKPGGRATVLDKFWNRPRRPPWPLRVANAMFGGYVTAIDRNFDAIVAQTSLTVVRKLPLSFGGLYFLYLLQKPSRSTS